MKDNRRKKIYMALSGVAIVAMMGISFASIRGCTRSDVATSTEATATDAVSEVTTVVDKTTEVTTTEKSKSNDKKGGSISGGVKKDHNTKESTSEEKSDDNDTKTPGTTEYTGSTEEPTTQRQADNDDGSSKKPPKKDEGKKDDGRKEPEKSTQKPVTPEKPDKPVKPDKPAEHVHTWKKVTKHHDAVTHKESVKIKDAWDEEVTDTVRHWFCGGCGMDFTAAGFSIDNIALHVLECQGGCNYYDKFVPVTKTVHHDAVYEDQTIIDIEAWDEYLYTECTTCGAIEK